MSKLLDPQGRTIADGDYVELIEVPFQWAALNQVQRDVLLANLSEAIQDQIREAIKERIRTSFDVDKFRKMSSKDVFVIQMALRVPVSLMSSILKEFDEQVKRQTESTVPQGMDPEGTKETAAAETIESGEAPVPPLRDDGHDDAEGTEQK